MSNFNGICCWASAFKSCFVSIRYITLFFDIFLIETVCVVFGVVSGRIIDLS